jgi:hypothetical protein
LSLAGTVPPARPGGRVGRYLPVLVGALAVWLGWQMVVQLLVDRAPAEIALRIAPTSPTALARAAEAELAAGRLDNAASLASSGLQSDPFNFQSLKVAGLTRDKAGDTAGADALLTLAGNWSLRDSEVHAWLVNQRLKRADYASAFAHAGTLLRRRVEYTDPIFELFETAYVEDARARAPLLKRLETRPPWRGRLLQSLAQSDRGNTVMLSIADSLKTSAAPLTDEELGQQYRVALARRKLAWIHQLRTHLNRPVLSEPVFDAHFTGRSGIPPFIWTFTQDKGQRISLSAADSDRPTVLRVEYEGFGPVTFASQMLSLDPGPFSLTVDYRPGSGAATSRAAWQVRCLESGELIANRTVADSPGQTPGRVESRFAVPATGCALQWIRLVSTPGDRRIALSASFYGVTITPVS